MENRLANLLRIVVDEYVATAESVGSQSLVEKYGLEVSSATIRHWFAELEAEGYLMQPHTSGGRIPTEKGFRTYIKLFVEPKPSAKRETQVLRKAATRIDDDHPLKDLAKALAELSGGAAVVGSMDAQTFFTGLFQLFSQPEFHDWERVVSMTDALDRLDETFDRLRRKSLVEPKIMVGSDCDFGPGCGAVFVSLGQTVIGILGPMRMDYQRNVSLLNTALKLLDE
ncbi:MAG: hypothetical protein Q8R07_04340 [Candidatus Uhrbacteria bacterium]|nr:hypothetical protein [Candidatus Uhrbacteria bacterium]